ncbi:unnamed protein product [Musa textilis]
MTCSKDNNLCFQKNMTIHQCTFVLGLLYCRSWRFPFGGACMRKKKLISDPSSLIKKAVIVPRNPLTCCYSASEELAVWIHWAIRGSLCASGGDLMGRFLDSLLLLFSCSCSYEVVCFVVNLLGV